MSNNIFKKNDIVVNSKKKRNGIVKWINEHYPFQPGLLVEYNDGSMEFFEKDGREYLYFKKVLKKIEILS